MARGLDAIDFASSLATVAIAALAGPVAAGATGLAEVVKYAEAMLRSSREATELRDGITGPIRAWAGSERVGELGPGLEVAAMVLAEYGTSGKESAHCRYDPAQAETLVVSRAAAGRFVELRTRASEDYVTVAKEAIRQTYTVLYARLGRDEQLLPAITVLLEESRRGAELMEKVSAKLDRIDARVETLSPVVSQQPGGRVVVGEIPALLLFPWAG